MELAELLSMIEMTTFVLVIPSTYTPAGTHTNRLRHFENVPGFKNIKFVLK
jgi:hypothetical protein